MIDKHKTALVVIDLQQSTARFAFEYGYQQIFVEDASAVRSAEEHEHTMKRIFTRLGRVRNTADVLRLLEG